ncbi:hypothetical protein D3C78_1400830 [compost metagenome]
MPLDQHLGQPLAGLGIVRQVIGLQLARIEQRRGGLGRVRAGGQGQVMDQMAQAALTGVEAIEQLVEALVEPEVVGHALQRLGQYLQGRPALPLLEPHFGLGQSTPALVLLGRKTGTGTLLGHGKA